MKVIKANFRIEFEPEIIVMGGCYGAIGENARGCLLLHSLQVSVTTELNVKGDGNTVATCGCTTTIVCIILPLCQVCTISCSFIV